MNKHEIISKLEDAVKFIKQNSKIAKSAAIVVIVIVALLFFAGNGEKNEISVDSPNNEITSEADETLGEEIVDTVDDSAPDTADSEVKEVYVDISGEVEKPGVYIVPSGTRLYQVIEKAGGTTEKASLDAINQAEAVTDGQKIIIPNKDNEESAAGNGSNNSNGSVIYGDPSGSGAMTSDGKININQADINEIQEIPGVGPSIGQKIIDYRNNNGKFSKPEDLKNVSGIGDKTFEKIKDYIVV